MCSCIHAVLLMSGEKLILLHETSPLSPINLSNYADFDQSKFISIKAQHGLTFNFWNGKIQEIFKGNGPVTNGIGKWIFIEFK